MREMGIRSGRLAARLGYRNISKCVRRLDEVCRGDYVAARCLPDEVVAAIEETRNEVERSWGNSVSLSGNRNS
jgi:hypothetical protein